MSLESMSLHGHHLPLHAADVSVSINAADLQGMSLQQTTPNQVRVDRELGNIVESELEIDSPFSVHSVPVQKPTTASHVIGNSVQIEIQSSPSYGSVRGPHDSVPHDLSDN